MVAKNGDHLRYLIYFFRVFMATSLSIKLFKLLHCTSCPTKKQKKELNGSMLDFNLKISSVLKIIMLSNYFDQGASRAQMGDDSN